MKFLSYGRQDITQEDIEAVVEVLKSDYLTQGPAISQFEDALCEFTGAKFSIACSNGTAALHLSMLAAGIGGRDRVLVAPITFVASANCAKYVGADVSFADIDPLDLTISPLTCRKALEKAKAEGRPFKAIVTVDLAGQPCDMEAFGQLKKEFNLIWIQDACHALGASWKNSEGNVFKVGEWTVPDMTVYSFHPVKNMTTGEGGAISTHNERFAQKLRIFRTHGITKESESFVFNEEAFSNENETNPWYYEMQQLGYNYRITDFQAALGISQLKRLNAYTLKRQEIASQYRLGLSDVKGLTFPMPRPGISHAYHLFIIRVDFIGLGITRAKFMNSLREKNIGTQVHYIPVPMMPYYAGSCSMKDLPNSLAYYREALSIPCFPGMSFEDVDRVCSAIKEILI